MEDHGDALGLGGEGRERLGQRMVGPRWIAQVDHQRQGRRAGDRDLRLERRALLVASAPSR